MIDSSELTPILIESMFTLLENFFSVLVSALNPVMIPILNRFCLHRISAKRNTA